MGKYKKMGYFQTFPFGVDMTDEELILARTLKAIKGKMLRKLIVAELANEGHL